MIIHKNIKIDKHKYRIEFRHNSRPFQPLGFDLTVMHKGQVISSVYLSNIGRLPFKKVIEDHVREMHDRLINEQIRSVAINKFENELNDWDGVIEP